jgi:hypothetical protein
MAYFLQYLQNPATFFFIVQAKNIFWWKTCGLYYKPMTIVNDDSRVITKLETSLTDDARVVIYNCHMLMVKATENSWFGFLSNHL